MLVCFHLFWVVCLLVFLFCYLFCLFVFLRVLPVCLRVCLFVCCSPVRWFVCFACLRVPLLGLFACSRADLPVFCVPFLALGVCETKPYSAYPDTTVYITHHTPGAVFRARLLDNQEGPCPNTERYVFGMLSTRCAQRRPFWHRHYSNCGDINHGKSAEGGVIYTVVPGIR